MGLRRVLFDGRVLAAALLSGALLGTHLFPGFSSVEPPWERASLAAARVTPNETLDLAGLERQFQEIGRSAAGSVVAISATTDALDADELVREGGMDGQKLVALLEKTTRLVGTGFVIDAGGYILTNEHVIADARQLWVTTDDRRVYPALVLGADARHDLAVLKVPVDSLPAVRLADGSSVHRGQWTIAIGNPYGLAAEGEMAMSVGVVSATDRSLPKLSNKEDRLYTRLIQTTAEINPGNSGGPLFDLQGRVIGINTAVVLPQKSTNGIGFAMPITPGLLSIVDRLKAGEEIVHGYLGVRVVSTSGFERRRLGVRGSSGVRVDSIEGDSPAGRVLRQGDVITALNDEPVRDSEHFVQLVGRSALEHPVRLTLYRQGQRQSVEAPLVRRPPSQAAVARAGERLRWRGMLVGSIPGNWHTSDGRHPEAGVLVLAMEPDSPARREGIGEGSIITRIAGEAVGDLSDLRRIAEDAAPQQWTIRTGSDSQAVVSIGE